jgi:hypothetical protein
MTTNNFLITITRLSFRTDSLGPLDVQQRECHRRGGARMKIRERAGYNGAR